ncbi:hypothetical protein PMIT1320_01586 [Prochlorococcus marinus str. MIT 1320]|nr:hypothetical protein PMIT1320_01586 [Prochlorococcus marinus str. MIT 1320]
MLLCYNEIIQIGGAALIAKVKVFISENGAIESPDSPCLGDCNITTGRQITYP